MPSFWRRKAVTPPNGEPLCSRRRFFSHLARSLLVTADELGGRAQMRLDGLSTVPDATLFTMVPVFVSDPPMVLGNEIVAPKSGQESAVICQVDKTTALALDLFDTGRPLGDIGDQVARTLSMEASGVRNRVRDLFLVLCEHRLCRPAQAHDT